MIVELRNQSIKIQLEGKEKLPSSILNRYHVYNYNRKNGHKPDILHRGYYYNVKDNSFYFPISDMKSLIGYLKLYKIDFTPSDKRDIEKYPIKLKMVFNPPYRDNQKDYVDELIKMSRPTNLVSLIMGGGKTFIAMKALSIIKERFLILIKAGYVNKWKEDLEKYYGFSKDDFYVFTGLKSIEKWYNLNKRKRKKYKVLILSTTTSILFIKAYEENKIDINPETFLKELNLNIILSDEVHQHFDAILKSILIYNPRYVIGLSATLIHKNPKKQFHYDLLFPEESKLDLTLLKPYIHLKLVDYRFYRPSFVVCKNYTFGYSQLKFEEYLVKRTNIRNNFFRMLDTVFEKHYLNRADENDRCLFLTMTRNMATLYSNHLKNKYDLDVRRNIREDSYEDLMEGKIIVATIGKSGTAVDLKNLFTVINLVVTDSLQSNLQFPGRLRNRKGKELRYIQLYSKDIDKHNKYIKDIKKYISFLYKSIREESVMIKI